MFPGFEAEIQGLYRESDERGGPVLYVRGPRGRVKEATMDARLNGAYDPEAAAQEAAKRVHVRNSRDGDVPAMLAIYLHHIRKGVDPAPSRRHRDAGRR